MDAVDYLVSLLVCMEQQELELIAECLGAKDAKALRLLIESLGYVTES